MKGDGDEVDNTRGALGIYYRRCIRSAMVALACVCNWHPVRKAAIFAERFPVGATSCWGCPFPRTLCVRV